METATATEMSQSEQTYVETIYNLIGQYGYARVVDIATKLCVKPPSVTNMLQKLDEQKFVTYTKYRGVVLTNKGKRLAKTLERRHQAFKEFLILIGVSEENAEKDACEIEHRINPETVEKLAKFVELAQSAPQTYPFLQNLRKRTGTEKRPKHCKTRNKTKRNS